MKVKALFLLFIFLFNTGVGFNCALHKDTDCCNEGAEHQHQDLSLKSTSVRPPLATIAAEDSCCQNRVNNFASIAKLVPQSAKILDQIPFADINPYFFYSLKSSPVVEASHQLLIDARQRPPTPDIRIVIQSLLI